MEEARIATTVIACFVAASIMFFGRFTILEMFAKAYCDCGHEFNEHNIVPQGRGYVPVEDKHSDETCKLCGCRQFKKNEKDKRNTPPIKFFPR